MIKTDEPCVDSQDHAAQLCIGCNASINKTELLFSPTISWVPLMQGAQSSQLHSRFCSNFVNAAEVLQCIILGHYAMGSMVLKDLRAESALGGLSRMPAMQGDQGGVVPWRVLQQLCERCGGAAGCSAVWQDRPPAARVPSGV